MAYDPENIFAKILRKEIPTTPIYEDDDVLALHDIVPAAPVHILVIPKGEFRSFDDFAQSDSAAVGRFFAAVQQVAAKAGLQENGYRLITNHGADANQTIEHFHVHIVGGKPLGGLLKDDALQR